MFSQSVLDKKAKKMFEAFPDETVARIEVSRKRTMGNNQEIAALFDYICSKDDNGAHYFGSVATAVKKQISRQTQPVFTKLVPQSEEELVKLTNNLNRIGMTVDTFLPPRARKKR